MRRRLLVIMAVLLAGCSAVGQPAGIEAGEEFTATFIFKDDCPPGTMLHISPATDRPQTPVNGSDVFGRFYLVEPVYQGHEIEFTAVGGSAYDLILVRTGMENSTMVWTATTRKVIFENGGDFMCEFPSTEQREGRDQ